MTNLVIYGRTARPAVAALLQGAAAVGLRPTLMRPHFDGAYDPTATHVIVDGWRGVARELGEVYVRGGVPVFIADLPRLRAGSTHTWDQPTDYVGLYENSLHHLPIRIGNRYPVLGPLSVHTPTHVLVCGQKPHDAAHDMTEWQVARWATDTIAVARQYGLPVVYRPHPHAPASADTFGADERQDPSVPLREALAHAAAVVVHNSTVGIDAIDAGVPVLYTAASNACCFAPYATPLGYPIRPLSTFERRIFLGRVGASQWTMAQLADGTALACLCLGQFWPHAEEVLVGAPSPAPETSQGPVSRPVGPSTPTEGRSDAVGPSRTKNEDLRRGGKPVTHKRGR
jgi:hypothetical protein